MEEWLGEWLRQKRTSTKSKTFDRYRLPVERFLKFVGPTKNRPLESVTPTMIREYREQEEALGKSATTCNMCVKVVGMAFTSAVRAGYVARNPAEGVESMADDAESKRPFTQEEIEALLRVADEEWRGLILAGLYTGARMGDLATMRWRNVDLEAGLIRFIPQKSDRKKKRGKELVIPIHPSLAAYLLGIPSSDDPESFLFPEAAARFREARSGLSKTFARMIRRAGIVSEVTRQPRAAAKGRSAGRTGRALTFHSFRHTLTSILHNAGVPVELRQKFTGHASAEMNARYSHTEMETLRAALENVPRIGDGIGAMNASDDVGSG